MIETAFIILCIVWSIAWLVFYHKVFIVFYVSLAHGLLRELLIALFIGCLMAWVTVYFWYIAAIIVIIAGLIGKNKLVSSAPLVIGIVVAIVIAVIGIKVRSEIKQANQNTYAPTQTAYSIGGSDFAEDEAKSQLTPWVDMFDCQHDLFSC